MSRESERFSESADLQRHVDVEDGEIDHGEGGDDCRGDADYEGYDRESFSTRGGAGASRSRFGQTCTPAFRGHPAMTRPFGPGGDFGYGRGGVPSRNCTPWFGAGHPWLRPPARGRWFPSPRGNRDGDPPPQRRPFFRGQPTQPGTSPRYPRIRGRFGGALGPRRGSFFHNNGAASHDYDHTQYGDRQDDADGRRRYLRERLQQDKPHRERSRPEGCEIIRKEHRRQGFHKTDDRRGHRETRTLCSTSDATDSENGEPNRPARDSEEDSSTSSSRIRIRSVAARVAGEAREQARGARTTTCGTSRLRTETSTERGPDEDDHRLKKRAGSLRPSSRSSHDQSKNVSAKPAAREVLESVEPPVVTTKAKTHGAKDKGRRRHRVGCSKHASSGRSPTAKRPALDRSAVKEKEKAAINAYQSLFSPISDDSGGDEIEPIDTDSAKNIFGSHSGNDEQEVRQCASKMTSQTLLASSDSTTNLCRERPACEDVARQIIKTVRPTETADNVSTVAERCVISEPSEVDKCPEIDDFEKVTCSQLDDAAAEGLSEISDPAACVEFTETCQPDLDSERETGRATGGESTDADDVLSADRSPTESVDRADHTASPPVAVNLLDTAASPQNCDRDAMKEPPHGSVLDEQCAAYVPSQRIDVRDDSTGDCTATLDPCEQDTVSFASTLSSCSADGVSLSSDDTSTETVSISTAEILFELNTIAALSVHEYFGDEVAMTQTVSWYVTGRRANELQVCSEQIQQLLVAAASSERAEIDRMATTTAASALHSQKNVVLRVVIPSGDGQDNEFPPGRSQGPKTTPPSAQERRRGLYTNSAGMA
ncbi:hypothetical protein HPB50_024970 [Hyalomma asiaticum]|uniref:Uncharacterized protein n=1 Tax=Hyalomma asiaticum TaxID=266040 RepID=A0ACB7RZA1_HYAAI|nr:hypothetical protein HPB50_024970 [Hyalomma asiaticum]